MNYSNMLSLKQQDTHLFLKRVFKFKIHSYSLYIFAVDENINHRRRVSTGRKY